MTDARPGWDRAATLNGLDLRFWGEMPLPLAEVGTRLDAMKADYLDALLSLAENTVTLAGAMGLAQVPPHCVPTAMQLLIRPAVGSRIELLWLLEGAAPGSTGWDPEEPAPEQAAFVALVNPGSQTRNPRTRQVFEAIAKLRNDKHHGRLAQGHHENAATLLEAAVFAMIRRNRRFPTRCYYVDSVQRAADGSEDVTAWTLWVLPRSLPDA